MFTGILIRAEGSRAYSHVRNVYPPDTLLMVVETHRRDWVSCHATCCYLAGWLSGEVVACPGGAAWGDPAECQHDQLCSGVWRPVRRRGSRPDTPSEHGSGQCKWPGTGLLCTAKWQSMVVAQSSARRVAAWISSKMVGWTGGCSHASCHSSRGFSKIHNRIVIMEGQAFVGTQPVVDSLSLRGAL